jgi:hypothetical protein
VSARFLLILLLATSLFAQDPQHWGRWRFLIGEWAGEGAGLPGKGTGAFSFQLELDGRVLVRKNRADYPATKDRPAYSHQDLMVIYPQFPNYRATYFDNEGHVIDYTTEFIIEGGGVVLTSAVKPGEPRYRLTYNELSRDKVGIRFEIAPPEKPDAFAPYIQATALRK